MKKIIPAAVASLMMLAASPLVSAEWNDNGQYINADGSVHTGWLTEDGRRYCFDRDGNAFTGLKKINGKLYYFRASDGSAFAGIIKVKGKVYCFSRAEGFSAVNGWQELGGKRYYFGDDFAAKTGLTQIDGDTYCFDEKGVMLTGLVYIDELVYDFGRDGKVDYSYIEAVKTDDGITWDMDEAAVREYYSEAFFMKQSDMLMVKTKTDLKYFVFDGDGGKLLCYGSDSPMKDRTEEFSAFLEKNGYTLAEETSIHEYKTLIYRKDGSFAAASGNGKSSIMLYASPAMSEIYLKGGKDELVKTAAEHGLPID